MADENEGNEMSTAIYRTYTDADKEALRELRIEMEKKLPEGGIKAPIGQGVNVSITDAIAAVTPGMQTPAHLTGM